MKERLLLFSYSFPPMRVQMTPAVIKPMAAISRLGYEVDVLTADSSFPLLPTDDSLLPYAQENFGHVVRLSPPRGVLGRLKKYSNVLSRCPDMMAILQQPAFETLMDMDLSQYVAVITWSPFHSINPVMVRLKAQRRNVPWIAQFSDPWAGNPLEVSRLAKLWNRLHEPRTVRTADFIVHSSRYSLGLMMKNCSAETLSKAEVIPHAFDDALYPKRPKSRNERITLRYVGILYGRRSPEPLFVSLRQLLKRRNDLDGLLNVELVGYVAPDMLNTAAAKSLPAGTITHVTGVGYLESLEKMYDADILLLIEADVRQNLFLPSKLSDYIGARTPIVGIAPPGSSEDVLKGLGCWHARPSDIDGIARAIETAVDYVIEGSQVSWCDQEYRARFSGDKIAERFEKILNEVRPV